MFDDREGYTYDNVECIQETSKAILCRFDNGAQLWIPQSQVHDDSDVYALNHRGKLVVKPWFAEKEVEPILG